MQQNPQNFTDTTQLPPQQHYGANEMFQGREALSAIIGIIDKNILYEQYVQDPELLTMSQKHRNFCSDLYNTLLETFQSGQDPAKDTQTYHMDQSNDVVYGIEAPAQPSTPAQTPGEINDQTISGFMLDALKSTASTFTMGALEMSNPVMRRLMADSVPNLIEMAYEVFLYQNKKQHYQVPQLQLNDMQAFQQSFAAAKATQPHKA